MFAHINIDDTTRFLHAMAPEGQLTFQTLLLNKSLVSANSTNAWRLSRTFHGSLPEHVERLAHLNEKGACVFFMANRGDGRGRKAENVHSVRSVFVDLDGAPLEPVLASAIPPSITVESSPGRFHAYWLVRGMSPRDFTGAQKALANIFGGDPKVCDLPRLMRLPGFSHRKTDQPFLSRLLTCEPELRWDWMDLSEGLSLPRSMTLPQRIPEGERNSTLFKLAVSAYKQGTAKEQRLATLLTVNATRCDPPLAEAEVLGIVDRVYRGAPQGNLEVPLALLSDQKFIDLDVGSKLLLILSHQRRRDAEFALLWNDFKQHFPRERTFGLLRRRLVDAGLLRVIRRATKPNGTAKAQPALYMLNVAAGR